MFPAIILMLQGGPDLQGQETKEQTGPEVSVERLSGEIFMGELMAVGKDAFVVHVLLSAGVAWGCR